MEFSQIITAQQARAYKPSLKIFELALSRIGVPAHRVLHVGQSLYHDVIPAQSLGLADGLGQPAIGEKRRRCRQDSRSRPDLQVRSLAD